MDQHEAPQCSREPDNDPQATDETKALSSDELVQPPTTDSHTPEPPKSFSITSNFSYIASDTSRNSNLLALLRPSLQAITSASTTTTTKPLPLTKPQTLFLQALSKLNESSISIAIINHIKSTQPSVTSKIINTEKKAAYLSPPDSLTSAPPSYSFVLRQMAARRRPRLMGTFIPSPSFVQHTPPPTYATAFDIYVDNSIPPPPPRTYSLGFASMPVLCPECGFTGMTITRTKITLCTHMCAFMLCLFCCWICVPLPYVLRSCKDVYHYCANCHNYLGMYCPTNPENSNYR
ncbi:hypothetical protein O3G_MSEX013222 [Manduca sexta]|uniref:LITAF domain-containing protein n=1 Tax=Manduca sexta TaxID=7130 RepID=A0A921ZS37_MANSE|nr:hypothetical protein O3G_MSEX013222 [Manduca sexta]KAG6462384.1 hypothetical protein O3G_MSEX013222 [Manduca sexta]